MIYMKELRRGCESDYTMGVVVAFKFLRDTECV